MLAATPIPIVEAKVSPEKRRATLTPGNGALSNPGAAASGATASTITTTATM